ncbi:MAG: electron transport complex subunit RsxC [Chromatiales bacterium]|nr:electron transport complex subunit RsxC [Chromatiales bacterium]
MGDTRHNLHRFFGGLVLDGHKSESTTLPITRLPMPDRLILPLREHIGEEDKLVVGPGDAVLKGQVLAQATDYVSAPLHAPTSGSVIDIGDYPVPHPSGLNAPCVVIQPDGDDRWIELPSQETSVEALTPEEIRRRVRRAGVVGLGGAAFPTAVKLNPGPNKPIHTLVLNGAECEPYITCDQMLMRERATEVVAGMRILMRALGAQQALIGVEDNNPSSAQALEQALADAGERDARVVSVPTRYPTGGERQLIKVLTGKEVPANGLPANIGIVCQNVATAAAVYHAVVKHFPLVSRVITVAGAGVGQPRNLEVLLGTPVADLIEFCGGYKADASRLLMGGPMMGFSLGTDQVPVIKATNCLLVQNRSEIASENGELPCIRCGECAKVCPAQLLPQQLYWYARARDLEKVQDYNLFDCIECGCCAHVCPAHIPLVQYYRYAKTEIWAMEKERRKSDLARRRHEARQLRIEQEKAEREERMRRKKEALGRVGAAEPEDPKKAAIAAAVERAKAKAAARKAGININSEQDGGA